MKKIYIIRHAKSSWKESSLDDFDRPLNKRGLQDASFMGKVLRKKHIIPDIMISSPALRAKTTAQLIAKEINFIDSIVYDKRIYEADVDTLYDVLKTLDDKYKTVFIFGHNPGLNMLVESLVDFHDNIPTCAVVELELECNKFRDISPACTKLVSFDYPKRYH